MVYIKRTRYFHLIFCEIDELNLANQSGEVTSHQICKNCFFIEGGIQNFSMRFVGDNPGFSVVK